MVAYWISEPAINVRIEDQPLGYSAALGGPVIFSLSYRQRGSIPTYPTIFGAGTNWSCSFRDYLVRDSSFTSGFFASTWAALATRTPPWTPTPSRTAPA